MGKITYAEREDLREHLGTYKQNKKRTEHLTRRKFDAGSLCIPDGMDAPLDATWADDNSAAGLDELADLYTGEVVVASGNDSCNDGAWWWRSCKKKNAYVLSRSKVGLRPMSVTYGNCHYVFPAEIKAVLVIVALSLLAAIAVFRHRTKP